MPAHHFRCYPIFSICVESRAEEARLVTEPNALTQDRDGIADALHTDDPDRRRLANELVQLRDAIFRSASWQLTAPLRRASQILSRRR